MVEEGAKAATAGEAEGVDKSAEKQKHCFCPTIKVRKNREQKRELIFAHNLGKY